MSRITLYRAEVDSPRLAGVLGRIPGVAVADGDGTDAPSDDPAASDGSEDGGGLRERIPVPEPDIDAEPASLVKRYGLLGVGVSLVMLGVATVGIWLYRRRSGDDDAETPPPATGLGTEGTTVADVSPADPSTGETESSPAQPSIVRPDAESEEERGRTEGDRSDVEWTTRETTSADADDGTEDESTDTDGPAETDENTRPTDSVDAAPLLGAAFLAATGVVVRWLQGADEGPTV